MDSGTKTSIADAVDVDDDPVWMFLEDPAAQVRDHRSSSGLIVTPARSAPCRDRASGAVAGRSLEPRVQVTNGNGQRVGRVVRRRHRRQAEQQLHHLLDLVLLGPAVTDDRALDLGRRVLDDRHARLRRPPASPRRARDRASARCGRWSHRRDSRSRHSRGGTPRAAPRARVWMAQAACRETMSRRGA